MEIKTEIREALTALLTKLLTVLPDIINKTLTERTFARSRKGTISFYKKSACLQCTLLPPKFTMVETKANGSRAVLDEKGAILFQLAKGSGQDTNGNNVYDWKTSLQFAVGPADIMTLMNKPDITERVSCVHKHTKGGVVTMKTLAFTPGNDGSVGLSLQEGSGSDKRINIFLTAGEFFILRNELINKVGYLLGWDD